MELFTLKAVLRLTGLNPDTVRAWEKRYTAVKPERTLTGRRMYSEAEVNRLKLLAELTYNGHSISTIAGLPDRKLVSLLATIKSSNPLSKTSALNPQIKVISDELMNAIDAFDLPKLESQLVKANYSMSSREFLFYLIPQIMFQVGNKVNDGSMSIAQEHALSEMIKKRIRKIYDDLELNDGTIKPQKTLLFATPENHLHEFGVLMAAVLCRFAGYQTHYLGPSLPSHALIEAATTLKAHAIVLGFSAINSPSAKESALNYVVNLEREMPTQTNLWLGGHTPSLKQLKFKRELWIFESMESLEKKLQSNQ